MTRARGWVSYTCCGWLLVPVVFLPTALGGSPARAQTDLFARCMAVRETGLFNQSTLACFPWLEQAVKEKLCQAPVAHLGQASWVGFGAGERWRSESCDGGRVSPLGPAELRQVWREAYEKLPLSLYGPWRACWQYLAPADPSAAADGPRCLVEGSYDLSGADETVVFWVRMAPAHWLDARTRLIRGLETEGVDCGRRIWSQGKKLSNTRPSRLECRRRGRSAVRFKVVTAKGTCEAELPELTEIGWRERCEGEDGAEGTGEGENTVARRGLAKP